MGQLESLKTVAEVSEYFDSLPAVGLDELKGMWKGELVDTGHPYAWVTRHIRWYGKEFISEEEVHPFVCVGAFSKLYYLNPRRIVFLALCPRFLHFLIQPLVSTRSSKARMRMMEFRGVLTAGMIYDEIPAIDVFRKIDDQTLLGWVDSKGEDQHGFVTISRVVC